MTEPTEQDEAGQKRYRPQSGKRYGGAYSPDGPQGGGEERTNIRTFNDALRLDAGGKESMRFKKRVWLIYAAAAPLVLSAFLNLFSGSGTGMIRDFVLFGIFCVAAMLLRQGIEAQREYEDKDYAVPPSMPRKLFGSLVIGGGLFGTALLGWDIGFIQSIAYGIFGAGASVLAFGLDPMKSKGGIAIGGITPRMVADAVDEAEEKIRGIEAAAADIHDQPLRERLRDVAAEARKVVARIEEDPSDLRRARKFLKIYLDGAVDATRKYVRHQGDHADSDIYMKFRSLLDSMVETFRAQEQKLLRNNQIDLDVEIEVLADRLKQEAAL